jgi:hypothetical protein
MHFARNPRTASRVIEGRAVVINIDENRLYTLNPQATAIWESLVRSPRLEDLVDDLCKSFDVSKTRARVDCETFLDSLRKRELVVSVA